MAVDGKQVADMNPNKLKALMKGRAGTSIILGLYTDQSRELVSRHVVLAPSHTHTRTPHLDLRPAFSSSNSATEARLHSAILHADESVALSCNKSQLDSPASLQELQEYKCNQEEAGADEGEERGTRSLSFPPPPTHTA
jgi:hypothetical protein